VSDSSIAFIRIGALVNTPPTSKIISFSNMRFTDMQIDTNLNLIDTEGLSYDSNVALVFSNLTFNNVSYSSSGSLLNLGHQLSHPLTIRDSSFSNLNNANVAIGTTSSVNEAQTTRVTFSNSVFDSSFSESSSLISVYRGAIVEFENCTFSNLHTLSSGAAITAGASKASVVVRDSSFFNNSAVEGGIFNIESESIIRCNSCSINNNFALTSGVVRINSNGHFYFYDTELTRNFAKNNPISLVFDSVNMSVLDKWEIYENTAMNIEDILIEVNSKCLDLCFLPSQLKDYINENIEILRDEISSTSLIQLISGSIKFANSSHIHDQDVIVNAFVSTVIFQHSTIYSVVMTDNCIEIVTSAFEFSDMNVTTVSNPGGYQFINVSSESSVSMNNIYYSNSNSILLNLRSSNAVVENLRMENITRANYLFEFYDTHNMELANFTVQNTTSSSKRLASIRKSKNVTLRDLAFENIDQSFFIIEDSHLTKMKNITFDNWVSPFTVNNCLIDSVTDSIFTQNWNSAISEGGALSIFNSNVTIANSIFSNNTAESGGAIHFNWKSMINCNLKITDSLFVGNNATSKGGAIYYGFKRPQLSNVTNQGNWASYGPDLASYAFKIKMVGSEEMVFNNVGSDIKYEDTVKLALLDYDDQVMALNNIDQIMIIPVNSSISSIRGVNSALWRKGIATFENIIAVAKYGSQNVKYKATSKIIDTSKLKQVYESSNFDNIITMNFRNCKPGESIIDDYKCQECSAGSYSLQWNSSEWYSCVDDAVCLGKTEISVYSGFWRMNTNSTKIIKCINDNACDGGYTLANEYPVNWAEGYSGVLWTECQITSSTKYQKVNDFECRKCPNMAMNTIRVLGIGLLVFIFFMVIIIINVRKTKESEVSVLFRIMTNYLQLLSTSMSFSSSFPESLTDIFTPIQRVGGASDTFLSFDCFITDYEIKGPFPSNVLFKLFLAAFLPIILTLIVSLIWLAIYFAHRKWVVNLKRCFIISFISIVFLLHPKLTELSFNLFRCVEIDEGESRVRIDTSMECFSYEHISWLMLLSFPILIVWVSVCPLIALYLLYHDFKKNINSKKKQYLLILYQGLKKTKFYWEFVNTLRKVLLLFILMLSDTLKILFSWSLLYLTIRLQIYLKPYKDEENNKIEVLALTAGLVTLLSSLIFISKESVGYINLIVLIVLIAINAKFLLEWAYKMLLCSSSKSKISKIVRILLYYLQFAMLLELILRKKNHYSNEEMTFAKKEETTHDPTNSKLTRSFRK
jgi:hypothetical protein